MLNYIKKHKLITIIVTITLLLMIGGMITLKLLVLDRYSRGYLPTDSDIQQLHRENKVYDHIVIFGVDGAGRNFEKFDTPNFDSIYKSGELDASVTYSAVSQFPTISAQNWTSMFHGVRCNLHKVNNEISENTPYTDTKYPSFFKVYGERHPDAKMVSIATWSNINVGIIEDVPNLTKINGGSLGQAPYDDGIKNEKYIDNLVCEEAIRQIANNPTIIFTHLDCVDAAGHAKGAKSEEYKDAMTFVDGLIGKLYRACVDAGWKDNTLFICVSDHGHTNSGGHGGDQPNVRNVTLAVAGNKGNIINGTPGYAVTQDVAAIVMYALGEKQPDSWEARLPKNMFK